MVKFVRRLKTMESRRVLMCFLRSVGIRIQARRQLTPCITRTDPPILRRRSFWVLVCTIFVYLRQISSINRKNTHIITIKSCNKVIKTINQVRTERRSQHSLGQCACMRKDEHGVIIITLIPSILLMLNSLFSFK